MGFKRLGLGAELALVAALGLGSAAGCSDGAASTEDGSGGSGAGVQVSGITFHKDVAPILHQACLSCHRSDQIAGFSLEGYEDAKSQAGIIAAVTEAGIMPPFPAHDTEECQPRLGWKNDPRLTPEQIAVFRAWADAGAPEGDPADSPGAFVPGPSGLPNLDLSITPSIPHTVDGAADQFLCMVYDPALLEDQYLSGINIVPGNSAVAHHALIFRAGRAAAMSASGGADRFPCFGAPAGELVHAWAPGGQPLELPDNIGILFETDQVIVVQMHYHPTGKGPETDASTIELRYHDQKPQWSFNVALPGNENSAPNLLPGPNDNGAPVFRIPANVTDHTEEMRVPLELPAGLEVPIYSVATHMHYVGTDARFWIERPVPGDQPAEECFVHTPYWDFNWQLFYTYDAPVEQLPKARNGDILRVKCKYNNSMSNRFVVEALAQMGMSAPIDVLLGETTLDEMCLAGVGYLLPF